MKDSHFSLSYSFFFEYINFKAISLYITNKFQQKMNEEGRTTTTNNNNKRWSYKTYARIVGITLSCSCCYSYHFDQISWLLIVCRTTFVCCFFISSLMSRFPYRVFCLHLFIYIPLESFVVLQLECLILY